VPKRCTDVARAYHRSHNLPDLTSYFRQTKHFWRCTPWSRVSIRCPSRGRCSGATWPWSRSGKNSTMWTGISVRPAPHAARLGSQCRLAVKGHTHVCLHDARGRVLFFFSQPLNDSLARALPAAVEEIRRVHVPQALHPGLRPRRL